MSKSKILRNLNRGFLLSAAIVIGVLIFLIIQNQSDKKLEPELKEMAGDFIADCDTVILIPEEDWDLSDISETYTASWSEQVESFVASASEDNKFYSKNDALREWSLDWLQSCAMFQYNNRSYITSAKTEIVKFNSFSVYKGKATLTFNVISDLEIFTVDGTVSTDPLKYTDTLTFEEEDGKWVITSYQTTRFWLDQFYTDGGRM